MNQIKRFPFLLLLFVFLFWGAAYWLRSIGDLQHTAENRFLVPPPEQIEYFTFGFSESVVDSLWLRWIQDSDYCQTYLGVEQPTANVAPPMEFSNPRHKICDNSWSFKMLDAITRLSPRFKMPYEYGAITLSVMTEDYAGATVIFDRGIAAYPNDWEILFRAAYHFLFDIGDLPKAADLFSRIHALGAPSWTSLLAARIYSKSGQIDVGLRILRDYRETIKDEPDAVKHVDKRIADLEKMRTESITK